jgi:putative membrane protein
LGAAGAGAPQAGLLRYAGWHEIAAQLDSQCVRTAAGGLGLQRLQVHSFGSALWAVVVISLLNLLVRPILVVLTLPVTLLTVGLFLFIINGLMFWAAANLLSGLSVSGFWAAVWAAFLYSLLGMVIDSALGRLFP